MASTFTNGTATATSASDLNSLITEADQQTTAGTLTIDISGLLSLDTQPAVANGETLTVVANVGTVTKLTAVPDIAAVNLHSGVSLVITGSNNAVLDGGNTVRGLFAYAGNLTVNSLTIQNTVAQGGAGANAGFAGGGGAGLGGGLFVAANANVTLNGVAFSGTKAFGGAGGNNTGGATAEWGGGGGLGGNAGIIFGGLYFSGGGGVGRTAFGGTGSGKAVTTYSQTDDTSIPGPGIIVGGASGGNGAPIATANDAHTAGAIYGGGGGMSSGTGHNPAFPSPGHYYGAGAGGGGVGGHNGYSKLSPYNTGGNKSFGGGGAGGFGGGGGAGYYYGGSGGFGGGGGAGQYAYGGNGGFGGGGGGLPNKAGTLALGGFGAGNAGGGYNIGNGKTPTYKLSGGDSGGGGLGAGGAVFVQSGGHLTLGGAGSVAAGTVTGGAGGVPTGTDGNGAGTAGTAGSAFGSGIFIQNDSTLVAQGVTLAPGNGQTLTVSGVIADEEGSGGTGGNATLGKLLIQGGGTVRLTGVNTFAGGSSISGSSTLDLGAGAVDGTGAITFAAGQTGTLQIDGTTQATMPTNTIAAFASNDHLDLRGLAFVSGATATYNAGTLKVISGGVTRTLSLSSPAQTTFAVLSDGVGGTPGSDITSGSTPTLSNVAASALFTEEGGAVILSGAVSITDPGGALTSATVSITGGTFANDQDLLAATGNGTITASYDSTNERLILSGSDTLANYQSVLDSVTFGAGENPTDFGSHATRTVTWVLNNGANESTVQTTTVSVTNVNDAPTLAGVASSAHFTEGGGAVTLSGSASVTDPDNLDLVNATVSITGGSFVGDSDVLAATATGSVTVSYDSANERLVLSGSDTLAHYQSVLDSVTFNAGENPTDFGSHTTRTVAWVLNDGAGSSNLSSVATTTVSITNVNDAPTLNNVATSQHVTEEGGAVTLSNAVSVTDLDNLDLASATVSVTGGAFAGDVLAATGAGGVTASYDSSNERLILSGSDTLANYHSVLDSVTFGAGENPTDYGSDTTRSITWVLNDGSASNNLSTAQTTTVSITNVNDAPTLTGVPASVEASVSGTVTLASSLTVSDPDNLKLTGATVSLSGGTGDVLATSTAGTSITASYNSTTETLTLTGSDTLAHYQQVLDEVTFSSTSSGTRTVTWVLNDGGSSFNLSTAQTETVSIVTGPSLSGLASASYTEEGAAATLSSAVTITDTNNSTTLASATVAITGGIFANDSDMLATSTTGTSIAASYNSASETLTLSGVDSLAHYQQVLDAVTFAAGENPTDFGSKPTRTITWTLNDGIVGSGAGTATSTVSITNVNDAPTLSGVAASAAFTEEGAAVTLAGAASVSDPDDLTLASATVSITGGGFAGDVLATSTAGTSITASYNSTSETLTLSGSDTLAHYSQVLDAVTFTAGENPTNFGSNPTRTITWVLNDGEASSSQSAAATTTLHITNVNDAPTLSGVAASAAFTEKGAAVTLAGAASVSDPDNLNLASATVRITAGTFAGDGDVLATSTAGTSITASYNSSTETLTLSGADTLAHYRQVLDAVTFTAGLNPTDYGSNPTRTIAWTLNDGSASSNLSTLVTQTVSVTGVNDPPSLSNVAATVIFVSGLTVTVSPALAVADPDNLTLANATVAITAGAFAGDGDVLSASTTGTSISASYNSSTETLTLTGSDTLAHYSQVLDSVTFASGLNPSHSGSNPSRTLTWLVNDGSASSNLSTLATTTISMTAVKNDFNGDGHSDLLWQNTDGTPAIALMNGTSITATAILPTSGPNWHEIGAGDFNGDGKADILWQNSDGTPGIALMNGTSITATALLPTSGPSWHEIATGDFNGDGKADILWQNSDGTPGIALMNGTSITATAILPTSGPNWHEIGTGDFNGDGKADILWQNTDGTPGIALMNGTSITATAILANPGSSWHVIGAGDFNGDGKADILWQNTDGTPMIWLMNGTSMISSTTLANPGAAWHALGTSDFNGDGKADIKWQNTDGTPMIWLMNSTSVIGSANLPNSGAAWHIVKN